ncbi:MAG: precorrin-4 C(11)-methyltransferase [Phocaeicola sp.]|nr:precorrin-4 C(11)-methyltransferase [Phocaeicola sp.]
MKTAILLISSTGLPTAKTIQKEFGYDIFSLHEAEGSIHVESLDAFLHASFHSYEALIFIGAMGICVRSIAPYIGSKYTDPAVLCVDSTGKTVISVLSGHVGGANELARKVASAIGAMPVITTQSDCVGMWTLDTLARQFDWSVRPQRMNEQITLFTSEKPTALLLSVRDKGTDWLERNLPFHVKVFYHEEDINQDDFELFIVVSPILPQAIRLPYVWYIPQCVHLGIGLAHQAQPVDRIRQEMEETLVSNGIASEAIMGLATIHEKQDEPFVKRMTEQYPIQFYSSDELSGIDVPNPSKTVKKYMKTSSVCEAAALLSSGNNELLLPKTKGADWTMAVALDESFKRGGHVEIVGAGPGDPDLISVRGRMFLEKADLILYAGSLVPRELTACAKAGATVKSSAGLALEEQIALMKEFYDQGKLVVRLHTGDPCLYGAIQEQMNYFDQYRWSYHITPGISAFQAAAAELRSQFTIPQKVQTIILTRGEGRTPMPDREKLHLLARSHSTMCIYLSADIVEKVQEELLMEYPETTPVAACYRLTWKEQRIYRGQLKDLTRLLRDHHLTLDTLIVVGDAIDNRKGLSELYSKHFTHLFRKATE